MPRAPNHWGAAKSPYNTASTFFNTVHLLPKDLRFGHGGAKLVSFPGRRVTSVRTWFGKTRETLSKNNLGKWDNTLV